MIPRRTRNNFSPWSLNSKVARILSISWVNAWGQSATNRHLSFPRVGSIWQKASERSCGWQGWSSSPVVDSFLVYWFGRILHRLQVIILVVTGIWGRGMHQCVLSRYPPFFWLMTNSKESGVEGVSRTWCLSLYEIWSSFASRGGEKCSSLSGHTPSGNKAIDWKCLRFFWMMQAREHELLLILGMIWHHSCSHYTQHLEQSH